MKVDASFKVNVNILKNFLDALKKRNAFPNDVIESFMKEYSKETIPPEPVEPIEGEHYTEKLLENCKAYRVGQLVRVVLRKLLEVGVASEDEILEMRKASGRAPLNTYRTSFGRYNKENFDTTFPLLITEQQKRDYDQNVPKFLVTPLNIRGESFHLSAQWYTHNRKPIEDWIRSHLPKWFERATEEQKSEMKSFIKTR